MYNCVICRYHEIATKGNNRGMFERCLHENMRHLLADVPGCKVRRVRGRFWVEKEDNADFTDAELEAIRLRLKRAFGLESSSPARLLPVDMDVIRQAACDMAPAVFAPFREPAGKVTFRIRARRSNKRFPLTSKEIEIDLISAIAGAVGNDVFTIDLDDAELTLGVEVRDEFAVLFFHKWPSPGGLPVGCNPKVLTLLSGGIDSPVAAYLIMKRGSPTDFITFHSSPYTPPETTEKVTEIARFIGKYEKNGTLHLVNLSEMQKAIRDCCKERFRTVLYRRAMLRIAEMVARRTHCGALVTGDALGQVASQTLSNMDTISAAVDMLILRPIVGADKLETIRIAEEIGTMGMSSVQVPDSCTVFAPSGPATSSTRELAEAEERKITNYGELLQQIVDSIESIKL